MHNEASRPVRPGMSLAFLLLAGGLFAAVTGNESYNLLPKFFSLQGYHPARTGFIMSFSGLGGVLVIPFLAFIIDHFRAKTILTFAVFMGASVPLLYFVPVPAAGLYGLPRAMQGALFAIIMVSFTAAVSHSLPEGKRSRGFALFGLMGQMGGLVSVAVGEPVFDSGGLRWLYIFSLIMFGLSLTMVRLYPEQKRLHSGAQPRLRDFAEVLGTSSMLLPLFYVFILGSGFGTMMAFLPDLVIERGLGIVRPFYIAYPITVAAVRLGLSHLFDRYPLHRVLLLPLIMIPLSMLTVYAAQSLMWLAAAGAGYGMAHGVMFPTLMGYLMDRSPVHFRGRMSSVFNLMFSFGLFISANLGAVFIADSAESAFLGMAVVTSTGVVLLLWSWLRR